MTRSRNRSKRIGPQISTWTNTAGPMLTYPHFLFEEDESMVDTVTPDFHRKMRQGSVINNPLQYAKTVINRSGGGVYHAVRTSNGQTLHGTGGSLTWAITPRAGAICPQYVWPSHQEVDLFREVKLRALASVDKPSYDFTEDVFSLRETAKFLRYPFVELSNLAWRWSRTHQLTTVRRKGVERAKALADAYFELQYGARPIVTSIDKLLQSLVVGHKPAPPARQASRATLDIVDQDPAKSHASLGTTGYTFTRSGIRKTQYKAVVLYELANPTVDWRKKYGLRLKDVPTVAWELYPLSFMVDHLVDVSACITALSNIADPSVRILSGCTVKRAHTLIQFSLVKQVLAGWTITISPDQVEQNSFSMVRSKWEPEVTDAFPVFSFGGVRGDYKTLAEMLGLSIQRIRSVR